MPPIPGIWMSINTIPAPLALMSSIADSPDSHSPAKKNPSVAARVAATARRKLAWSSTTQTGTRSSAIGEVCTANVDVHHGADTTLSRRGALIQEHQDGLDSTINPIVSGQAKLGKNRID